MNPSIRALFSVLSQKIHLIVQARNHLVRVADVLNIPVFSLRGYSIDVRNVGYLGLCSAEGMASYGYMLADARSDVGALTISPGQ